MSSEAVIRKTDATQESPPSQQRASAQGTEQVQSATPRNTPPSSPPLVKHGDLQTEMPPPRKRSIEQIDDAQERVADSSSTAVGGNDSDLRASQVKQSSSQIDCSATVMPSTLAHTTMPPPAAPVKGLPPPPNRSLRSGQGSSKAQPAHSQQSQMLQPAPKTERVASTSQERPESDDTIPDEDDSMGSESPGEPQDQIVDFDWGDLEKGYHDKITELNANERAIFSEFNELCDYFALWAATSQTHEVDRSFKRLKTQMTLVRHQEDELEQKRGHYIKVVEAFKSALQLLGT